MDVSTIARRCDWCGRRSGPRRRKRSPRVHRSVRLGPLLPYLAPAYQHSRLRSDQVAHAKNFVQRLMRDKSDGRIGAPAPALEEMAMAVAEARADGINLALADFSFRFVVF